MAQISRSALFGKLNRVGYQSLESATVFCKLRSNPYVELLHWIHQILQQADSDLHRIAAHFQLDTGRLAADLTASLDQLPRGATAINDFSPHLEEAAERGWLFATLLFSTTAVRTGHLLVGILENQALRHILLGASDEFSKISLEQLTEGFDRITASSPEAVLAATDGFAAPVGGGQGGGSAQGASGPMAPAAMGKQEALNRFTVDLTEKARSGKLDPIVGRDNEIRQVVDILMRRRQNNPILTGEAGVGKTAVVEGFAQRIAAGDVPPALKDVSVRTLDLGMLQAGASMKGEFENRLKQLIDEVQTSPKPIILFIDEAHTLIGAGGAAGTSDAANLLKPALARGTLRTIAATTWAEYKKYFEKDPALTRRFQVVQVSEPEEEKAVAMIRSLADVLEAHHGVMVLAEGLEASVRLSRRYIPARQLPDKAVSLMDTACARVAISQKTQPPRLEDCRRQIESLEAELRIIQREEALGIQHTSRKKAIGQQMDQERKTLSELEIRWSKEKELGGRIVELRRGLRQSKDQDGTAKKLLAELEDLQKQLGALQGQEPLVLTAVDGQVVASVVADWTGIPVGRMVADELRLILELDRTLRGRVIGQDHGLEAIAKRIQTSRANLENPNRPIGVFLLVGPSGVGKTETALALAEALYGGEHNLITINMSEFQESHTVSTLKGSPPGYVGYGEGGVLTEAVRRRPYSVVLLDEVEKAHPDVHEIFFQVFDKGWMEDGEGRFIDFKNTIILLTSNAGSDLVMKMCKDPALIPDSEALASAMRPSLLKVFPPALLGRLSVVPYYPISDQVLRSIIVLQMERIRKRLLENHQAAMTWDDAVLELVARRCTEQESGARMVDAILSQSLLPTVSRQILTRLMEAKPIRSVHVVAADGQLDYQFQ